MKAVVHRLSIPADRRILAVSDIHGNLAWLRGLLARAALDPGDVLVIVGDLLEKGPESLETLRFVMDLSKTRPVYCVMGNCDGLCLNLRPARGHGVHDLMGYLRFHPESLVWQLAAEAGFPLRSADDLPALGGLLETAFPREMAFLRAMPTVLETDDYVFVHGGVPSYEHMEDLSAWACMKNDDFMGQGHSFPKYCVVGHWPTTLYRVHSPDADPLVDRTRRILSIDGGCVLKRGGQLNGVLLPRSPSEDFVTLRYDDYPQRTALDPQEASRHPVNIRWVDNAVEVLEQGEEFSLCRQKSTGQTLWVLTSYLGHWGGSDRCEDATDHRLAVSPGDRLGVVEETSRGALVKKEGRLGWYYGRLEPCE